MLANHPVLLRAPYDKLNFKTGDMILFHAYDNINPVFIGSYWGHVGIVYNNSNFTDEPLLFEAARTSKMEYCPESNKCGIMITNLKTRLEKYPGLVACKILNRSFIKKKIFFHKIRGRDIYGNNTMLKKLGFKKFRSIASSLLSYKK